MIVVINEGVTVTPEHNSVLLNVVNSYYKNTRFVYITHRLNSYAVNPAVYRETSKIKNLAGFCVVSNDYKAKRNAEIEKLFLNKPFEIFDTIEEAVIWANTITNTQHN
jgi:hypothetical protein